ncbi:MAG: methyltransferase domain-containing protein [Luteitalea sp.]|nr:methyltransferase domain-containing protein [Luteitalea sp.]
MIRTQVSRRLLLSIAASLVSADLFAQAQAGAKPFEPQVGQTGKDVVWVPTPQALVDKMLDLAEVTAKDVVVDLGSGDGRTVITAAKRGARARGIEYEPEMVALSQRNAAAEGVTGRASFAKADLFTTDFSDATVVTMFLLPSINVKLRPKLLEMKPGTRVVSNTFTMEDWEADETATIPDCDRWCTALFWIVPAKVEGVWRLDQGELELKQQFQNVTGSLRAGGTGQALSNGKLRGEEISFSVGTAQYTGRVNGDAIQGTVTSGATKNAWRATRAARTP